MQIIDKISVHNSGGLGTDYKAKTQNLTIESIDKAHRNRWPDFKSKLGYYVGYTICIFADGSYIQTRLIGEEGAHTIGANKTSVGILLTGNFTKGVETPNYYQTTILKKICEALLDGHPERMGLKVKEGTNINISLSRILPHRRFSTTPTECYGDSMNDLWVQKLLASRQPTREQLLLQLRDLLQVYFKLLAKKQLRGVGSSCVSSNERG